MRHLVILCLVAIVAMVPTGVLAKAATIPPMESLRLVNPDDAGDVRILYRFSLPEDAIGAEIIRAFLTIKTEGKEEALFTVAPLDGAWSSSDTWTSASVKLATSKGFASLDERAVVVANHLEEVPGQEGDTGIEVSLSSEVQSWAKGGSNFGVCVRRLAGGNKNVSTILTTGIVPPELSIIYISTVPGN